MGNIITGRVWKFGDHINTDYMHPSFASDRPWEELQKYVLHIHKGFTQGRQPGDVIVAGKNFGCGSSREGAPRNLKRLGIGCVVAESFGRIFFRNCIANALPVLGCKGVSDLFQEGEQLELDFEKARVKNLTTGKELRGPALPDDLIQIVKMGGILALLKSESQLNA
jgi:3-isopropylmalate/(R)-2-methylmalate dehydratase small subunit